MPRSCTQFARSIAIKYSSSTIRRERRSRLEHLSSGICRLLSLLPDWYRYRTVNAVWRELEVRLCLKLIGQRALDQLATITLPPRCPSARHSNSTLNPGKNDAGNSPFHFGFPCHGEFSCRLRQ